MLWKFAPASDGGSLRNARVTFAFDLKYEEATSVEDEITSCHLTHLNSFPRSRQSRHYDESQGTFQKRRVHFTASAWSWTSSQSFTVFRRRR